MVPVGTYLLIIYYLLQKNRNETENLRTTRAGSSNYGGQYRVNDQRAADTLRVGRPAVWLHQAHRRDPCSQKNCRPQSYSGIAILLLVPFLFLYPSYLNCIPFAVFSTIFIPT